MHAKSALIREFAFWHGDVGKKIPLRLHRGRLIHKVSLPGDMIS